VSFSGSTPGSFDFGSIVLTNQGTRPEGTFGATLNLHLDFTNPDGQSVDFEDGLQIVAQSGGGNSGHGDQLWLNFQGYPDPQSFTVGSEIYAVTYDGFFDSDHNPVTDLFVENNPGGTATAHLWGTITSVDPPAVAPVPEPGSAVLLLTVAAGCIMGVRRKRARA